eukprot:764756_1
MSSVSADSGITWHISDDDIEPLDVDENDDIKRITIPQSQILRNGKDHHAIYHIHIEKNNFYDDECDVKKWIVMKRFQDFINFDKQIRAFIKKNYPLKKIPTHPTTLTPTKKPT